MERHERAVANTLGFAREAAFRGDFQGALEWLAVVEVVDGVLPPGVGAHAGRVASWGNASGVEG